MSQRISRLRPTHRRLAVSIVIALGVILLPMLGIDRTVAPASAQDQLGAGFGRTSETSLTKAGLEYEMISQWPDVEAELDVMVSPASMAVAADGTVYLADRAVARVSIMSPDGTWTGAFGHVGNGPERLGVPGRIEVDEEAGHVYVSDEDSYRIAVFDLDGKYLTEWPQIYASGLSIAPDGLLWVADLLSSQVRAFDSSGREVLTFGSRGSGEGRFRQMSDVSVSPSGEVYVGDRNGTRIQIFRPDESMPEGMRLIRTMNLTGAKYSQIVAGGPFGRTRRSCQARDLDVIDDDTLIAFPCRIDDGEVEFLSGPLASENLRGFFLPYCDPRSGMYYSLAIHIEDPDDWNSEVRPAIVRYSDDSFRGTEDFWLLQPFDEDSFWGPQRVDVIPDGPIYVTDFRGVRGYTAEGSATEEGFLPVETFPTDPISITLQMVTGTGEPGEVVGLGTCRSGRPDRLLIQSCVGRFNMADDRTFRGEPIDYLVPEWTTTLPADSEIAGFHYDAVNQLILVLDNDEQILLAYPLDGMGRKETWPLGGSDRTALFADVTSGADGTIFVLDVLRDQIQVRGADGDIQRTLTAPSDSWRIAGGQAGETFLLVASFGEVVRIDGSGQEIARFNARPSENAQPRNLIDLSVSAGGEVFVVDRQANLVSVYAPTGEDASEVLAGSSCLVRGDKTASPSSVPLGGEVDMELSLGGSCGAVEQPSNVLILVNTKSSGAYDTARQIVSLADFSRHRVGLMGYYVSTVFKVRWTQDVSRIITGLESLSAGGGSNSSERNALDEALVQFGLEDGRGVVVMIGGEYCVRSESTECAEQHDAEASAQALRDAGVRVVMVNGSGDAGLLATSDLDTLSLRGDDLSAAVPVYQRVTELVRPDHLIQTGLVRDVIPDVFDYVPGSAEPPAAWDEATRTLTWDLTDVPYGGASLTYKLEPTMAGTHATNVEAVADYVDGWDGAGTYTFPVPEVDVVAPPTAEPTPTDPPVPTATPSPTASPPQAIFLPITYASQCIDAKIPLEVALVIDISSSMAVPTSAGGSTKIEAARNAALSFIDTLREDDRAAVVAFDAEASLVSGLGDGIDMARASVAGLETGSGTAIDAGILTGVAALGAAREGATKAMIVLTDGRPSTSVSAVRSAAVEARDAGVELYTIGLGADLDEELLIEVAGDAERYLAAPDSADLAAVFDGLARSVRVCR